jgi:hypothetical protein
MDIAETVSARVIAGPGDLMSWEVSACIDTDGIPIEVLGRGTDMEMAAASAIAVLTANPASTTRPTEEAGGITSQGNVVPRPPSVTDGATGLADRLTAEPKHPPASRVVYRNRPYLLQVGDDGASLAAFGPFAPGTEPSMAECGDDNRVHDTRLLDRLERLMPVSPDLPAAEDTLAGS